MSKIATATPQVEGFFVQNNLNVCFEGTVRFCGFIKNSRGETKLLAPQVGGGTYIAGEPDHSRISNNSLCRNDAVLSRYSNLSNLSKSATMDGRHLTDLLSHPQIMMAMMESIPRRRAWLRRPSHHSREARIIRKSQGASPAKRCAPVSASQGR